MRMDGKQARDLCVHLLWAESEDEIVDILEQYGYWQNTDAWQMLGNNENNFSIVGNQQSNPAAAMVEKFVNSVDAVLMRECYRDGLDPEGPEAPQSIAEALERYFGVRKGNLADLSASRRAELAANIGFVATGRKRTPNYTVFDWGEGQTPNRMPFTLLSLARSNKLRIPFVQGKFNMGGTGVLQFCGDKNFQLIISRRDPWIADPADPTAGFWGFTIVRRQAPDAGRRSSMYTYLAPGGEVPRFTAETIQLPDPANGGQQLPALEWGTIIKMYEYEMTGLKTNILFDFYNQASLLLPRVGLPIRFYERRGYSGHSFEATMSGLHVRLEEDTRDNLESGFPTHFEFKVSGETMRATLFAFKKGGADKYRKREGILFTINGQTHGVIRNDFFARKAVGMAYLSDSLLVIVECDGIGARTREDLFMNSRDRLRSGDLRQAIEGELQDILRSHPGLRELRERRRREEIENRLADSRPLKNVLNDILKKSPALTALFITGADLSNPFRSKLVGEQESFEGKPHPSYFTLKRGDEFKKVHINLRFRAQFETDVVNDYFGRDRYPGRFTLLVNGQPTQDYVLNLWNGIANLTVRLPDGVQEGDALCYECWVEDDTLIEPFYNSFTCEVIGPHTTTGSSSTERKPPAGKDQGDRQKPEELSMPQVIEVREEEWEEFGFDKLSALQIKDTGEEGYDFFINMDNLYLRTEIKAARDAEPRLLEARFKYALVLIGLSLLREQDVFSSNGQGAEPIEKQIYRITSMIAPVLLPMIDALGDLVIDDAESIPVGFAEL